MKRLWLLALVGCNDLLGLVKTAPIGDEGRVTGVYLLRSIENQPDGTPVVMTGPYARGALEVDVELDDGTSRDVTLADDGSFSFTTATIAQRYSLTFRSRYSSRTYQHDAANLTLVERVAGRADRQLVPTNTFIDYALTNRPVSTTAIEEIQSTGIWARVGVTGLLGPNVDWAKAVTQTEPLGMLDAARNDVAYYVQYDVQGTYYRPMWSARASVTLQGGQTTTVTATAAPVAVDMCTRLQWDAPRELERITSSIDDEVNTTAVWNIVATPSDDLATTAKLPLALSNGGVLTAVDDMVSYGNPYSVGTRRAELSAIVSRNTAQWISLAVTTPVEADCTTPTILPVGEIQYALSMQVADSVLDSADQIVAIDRSAPVRVTWQASATGRADDASLVLYEVVPTPGGLFVMTLKAIVYTTAAEATLDPALLESGHKYALIVTLRGGLPGASIGDYDQLSTTLLAGGLHSLPFRVQ